MDAVRAGREVEPGSSRARGAAQQPTAAARRPRKKAKPSSSPAPSSEPIPRPYLALAPKPISSITQPDEPLFSTADSRLILPSTYVRGSTSASGSGSPIPQPATFPAPSKPKYANQLLSPPTIMPGGQPLAPRVQGQAQAQAQGGPAVDSAGAGRPRKTGMGGRRRSEERLREIGTANVSMLSLGVLGRIMESDPQEEAAMAEARDTLAAQPPPERRRRRIVRGETGITRRPTVSSREEGRALGLARGASMRRINLWEELPDLPESSDPPPAFPFPTTSTSRLPPTFESASTSPPSAELRNASLTPRARSPPPSFEQAILLPLSAIRAAPGPPPPSVSATSSTVPPSTAPVSTSSAVPLQSSVQSGSAPLTRPTLVVTTSLPAGSDLAPSSTSSPTSTHYASAPTSPARTVLSMSEEGVGTEEERADRRSWNADLLAGYTLEERVKREIARKSARGESSGEVVVSMVELPTPVAVLQEPPIHSEIAGTVTIAALAVNDANNPSTPIAADSSEGRNSATPVAQAFSLVKAASTPTLNAATPTVQNFPADPVGDSSLLEPPGDGDYHENLDHENLVIRPSSAAKSATESFQTAGDVDSEEPIFTAPSSPMPSPQPTPAPRAKPLPGPEFVALPPLDSPGVGAALSVELANDRLSPQSAVVAADAVASSSAATDNIQASSMEHLPRPSDALHLEIEEAEVAVPKNVELQASAAQVIELDSSIPLTARATPTKGLVDLPVDQGPTDTTEDLHQDESRPSRPATASSDNQTVAATASLDVQRGAGDALMTTEPKRGSPSSPDEGTKPKNPSPTGSDIVLDSPGPKRKLTRGKAIRRSSSGLKSSPSSPGHQSALSSPSTPVARPRPLFSSPSSGYFPRTVSRSPRLDTAEPVMVAMASRISEPDAPTALAETRSQLVNHARRRSEGEPPSSRLRASGESHPNLMSLKEEAVETPSGLPPHREAALKRRELPLARNQELSASPPKRQPKIPASPNMASGPLIDLNDFSAVPSPKAPTEIPTLAAATAELLALLEDDAQNTVAESSAQAAARLAAVEAVKEASRQLEIDTALQAQVAVAKQGMSKEIVPAKHKAEGSASPPEATVSKRKPAPPPPPSLRAQGQGAGVSRKPSVLSTADSPITPRPIHRAEGAATATSPTPRARAPSLPTRRPPPPPPSSAPSRAPPSPVSPPASMPDQPQPPSPPPAFVPRPTHGRNDSSVTLSTTSSVSEKVSTLAPIGIIPRPFWRNAKPSRPRGPRPPPVPPRPWAKLLADSLVVGPDPSPPRILGPPRPLGERAHSENLTVEHDVLPSTARSVSTQDLRSETVTATGGPVEYTDLDVLVSRIEGSGREYEGFSQITSFLGPAKTPAASPAALSTLLPGLISVDSRRTTSTGKTKLKLSLLGVRVSKCPICLAQYRDKERGVMLPDCGHSAHEHCARRWFREDSKCFVCRDPLRETEGVA